MLTFYRTFIVFLLLCFCPLVLFAKSLPDIKIPPYMKTSQVRGGVNLGGLNVKTYVFQSSKGNKEILKFYNELWGGKVRSVKTDEWIFHSYFDGTFLYSIQVSTKGKGGSFFTKADSHNGILAVSEPGSKKSIVKRVNIEKVFPIRPGSKVLSDLSAVDLGKKSRTIIIDSPGSVLDNLYHYKSHFENLKWKEVLNKMSLGMARELGGTSLIMQRGLDELVVNFIPSESGTKIVSVLVTQ